jgi:predicted ribosomally synthesized peptide with SipW-like signal peptide
MKRKVRLSALVAVLVLMLALLIGGLYGTFADTEESTGNVFTAGTLNLLSEIDGVGYSDIQQTADGINDNITFGMVVPGDTGSITWTLTNDGSIDGTLVLATTVNFTENGLTEPEAADGDTDDATGELDTNMVFTLTQDGTPVAGPLTFDQLVTYLNDSMLLTAGQTTVYVLDWSIDSGVNNVIQSDTAQIDITFTLSQ